MRTNKGSGISCVSDNNIVIPVSGSSSEAKVVTQASVEGACFRSLTTSFLDACNGWEEEDSHTHAKTRGGQYTSGLERTGIKGTSLAGVLYLWLAGGRARMVETW